MLGLFKLWKQKQEEERIRPPGSGYESDAMDEMFKAERAFTAELKKNVLREAEKGGRVWADRQDVRRALVRMGR